MVKTKNRLVPQGRILSVTVLKEPSGRYYISLCCTDVEVNSLAVTNRNIGIDVGIKDFVITSYGKKISNKRYLHQSLNKLVKVQRGLFRKTKGSSNWNKAELKLQNFMNI